MTQKRIIYGLIVVLGLLLIRDIYVEIQNKKNPVKTNANLVLMESETESSYMDLYPDMFVTLAPDNTGKGTLSQQEEEDELLVEDLDFRNTLDTNRTERIAYLTFDDGPSEHTVQVLDTLKENQIHATFFLIGNEITQEREEIVRRMSEEGHAIGVHTYCHDARTIYASIEKYLDDFHQVYERILEVTGKQPTIFRFPWGSANSYNKRIRKCIIAEMERRGFTYYDWNVSADDAIGCPTKYSIYHNVTDHFSKYKEPVILMHDGITNELSAKVLPEIIQCIKKANYGFDTVNHRSKPYQYPRK